jgi:hypothetical protein
VAVQAITNKEEINVGNVRTQLCSKRLRKIIQTRGTLLYKQDEYSMKKRKLRKENSLFFHFGPSKKYITK